MYLKNNKKVNNQYSYFWIFIVLISNSISITSQRMPKVGSETWLAGNLSLKVNKHWEFNLENQSRYSINYIDFDRNFTEFQIQEKVNDQLQTNQGHEKDQVLNKRLNHTFFKYN